MRFFVAVRCGSCSARSAPKALPPQFGTDPGATCWIGCLTDTGRICDISRPVRSGALFYSAAKTCRPFPPAECKKSSKLPAMAPIKWAVIHIPSFMSQYPGGTPCRPIRGGKAWGQSPLLPALPAPVRLGPVFGRNAGLLQCPPLPPCPVQLGRIVAIEHDAGTLKRGAFLA